MQGVTDRSKFWLLDLNDAKAAFQREIDNIWVQIGFTTPPATYDSVKATAAQPVTKLLELFHRLIAITQKAAKNYPVFTHDCLLSYPEQYIETKNRRSQKCERFSTTISRHKSK
ncbi:hypothetical protein AEYBE204_00015 [Asticcacaulis sp. YBE204]|nr:hypothetical protein AEYBE204_00015 [Asticcacaulis sp. YBE204]